MTHNILIMMINIKNMAIHKRLIMLLPAFVLMAYNLMANTQPEFYSRYMKYSSEELLRMGNIYAEKSKLADSALVCFSIVVNRATKDMNLQEKQNVMIGYIGRWYVYFFGFFDYEKSYANLLQAKRIAEETGLGLSRINLNFGCMYQMMAEQSGNEQLKNKALAFYRKAFEESMKACDESSLNMAFSNMVFLSSDLGKLDSIHGEWASYNKTEWVKDSFNRKYNINMYNGLKLYSCGKYAEALKVFQEQKQNTQWDEYNTRYLYIVHINTAKVLSAMGRYTEAINEIKKAEKIALRHDMKDAKLDVYRLLAEYYAKKGENEITENYRNKYFQLKDTLLNYNQVAKVSELQFLDKMNEIDKRMAEITRKREQQAVMMRIGAGVTTVILLLGVMLFVKNKKLKRSNEHLYKNSLASLQREEREREMRLSYEQRLKEKLNAAANVPERYSSSGLGEEDKEILLNKILNVMQTSEEIFSPDFKADRLVELVGSNNRYVSQAINEKLGCNFTTLLNEYRVKEMCKRMNNVDKYGNLTINAIANSVGFRSHSGLFTAFKKVTGLTPAQYQKLAKENKQEA